MKYIAFVLGLLLIASCATSSPTSPPVNIDGTWEGEYDSGMGGQPMLFTFSFLCDRASLAGNMNNAAVGPDRWTRLKNGKIRGNNISFTTTPSVGPMKMTFEFKREVNGDKIKLAFRTKMPGMSKSGTGSRLPVNEETGKLERRSRSNDTDGPGMGLSSSPSQEFTIRRVKQYKRDVPDLKLRYVYIDRGDICSQKQQYGKTVSDYSEVIETIPHNAFAYYMRGSLSANAPSQ